MNSSPIMKQILRCQKCVKMVQVGYKKSKNVQKKIFLGNIFFINGIYTTQQKKRYMSSNVYKIYKTHYIAEFWIYMIP